MGIEIVTWRGITDPNSDLDALIEGFFKDEKVTAAEGRRARMEGWPWVVELSGTIPELLVAPYSMTTYPGS